MNSDIATAIAAAPDYSPAFTHEVERLAERLRVTLGWVVDHQRSMDYSSSQQLVIYVDAAGRSVSIEAPAAARIVAYVSSKAKLFTTLVFRRQSALGGLPGWCLAADGEQQGVSGAVDALAALLEREGYQRLSGPMLWEVVQGHTTDMDGVPATLFDVLFSELQ